MLFILFGLPLSVADSICSYTSHKVNGLIFRHLFNGNFALSNTIDEHSGTGTCRHMGTFEEIDLYKINVDCES